MIHQRIAKINVDKRIAVHPAWLICEAIARGIITADRDNRIYQVTLNGEGIWCLTQVLFVLLADGARLAAYWSNNTQEFSLVCPNHSRAMRGSLADPELFEEIAKFMADLMFFTFSSPDRADRSATNRWWMEQLSQSGDDHDA